MYAKVTAEEGGAKAATVLEDFASIEKEQRGKDSQAAADGMLRAALYASSPLYGSGDIKDRIKDLRLEPGQASDEIRDLRLSLSKEGDYRAHDALKQLVREFSSSDAAAQAKLYRFQQRLEASIDRRNSAAWYYKLIDGLVAMTGRKPAFSYWFALILVAVFVAVVTYPIKIRMFQSQREMQRIQPILKRIQDEYKGKPELQEKVMECYKEHGVNPFASCLPMLIQLPFMYGVYYVIRQYEFHFAHGTFLWINPVLGHRFPGILAGNLAEFDVPLVIIYAASTYLTMKLTPPTDPQAAQQQQTMSIMMTGMMLWMFWTYKWSSAFILYWLASNVISSWQQYNKIYKPNKLAAAEAAAAAATPRSSGPSSSRNGGQKPVAQPGAAPVRPATSIGGQSAGQRPRPRKRKR
jgi:YidC/Oxa1 family membrane protein insertase